MPVLKDSEKIMTIPQNASAIVSQVRKRTASPKKNQPRTALKKGMVATRKSVFATDVLAIAPTKVRLLIVISMVDIQPTQSKLKNIAEKLLRFVIIRNAIIADAIRIERKKITSQIEASVTSRSKRPSGLRMNMPNPDMIIPRL